MNEQERMICPDCDDGLSRRDFVKVVGTAAVAAGALPVFAAGRRAEARPTRDSKAETDVKRLYDSLTQEQKKVVVLPWDHQKRTNVSPNWKITEATVGEFFNADQQEIIKGILKGITSEEGYEKFLTQMANDWPPGLPRYTVAIFGDPDQGKFEFEMTGRHLTLRADGDSVENAAFGGPIVYGHGPQFREKPHHPGNVFWYQAKRANEVFGMLDGKQREQALLKQAPRETAVQLRQRAEQLPGIAGSELSSDQRELLEKVLADIMAPYRKEDVHEVLESVKAGGGMDQVHIAFYKTNASGSPKGDIGQDGVWDIWRLESPTLVCHFRGSPHIHAYINVAKPAQ